MCMGLASGYREPKENLTVIRCEKCGRSWQVTEAAAKHYNEYYKGICADCRSGEEKKQSLLKQDSTEKFKEKVCDEICRHPWEASSQEDLDDRCEDCILNKVKKVELEG